MRNGDTGQLNSDAPAACTRALPTIALDAAERREETAIPGGDAAHMPRSFLAPAATPVAAVGIIRVGDGRIWA